MYLVEVVVFLRFEKVEGLPLLFTGSSQQVIEDMVVPTKQSSILVTPSRGDPVAEGPGIRVMFAQVTSK